MAVFRSFNSALWELFCGNLLLLATCAFYIAWWSIAFWPGAKGGSALAGVFLPLAALAGLAAIVATGLGVQGLARSGARSPTLPVIVGAAVFYLIALAVTKLAFQRELTSELLVMSVWAAIEVLAILALRASGRFGPLKSATLLALVGVATAIGLVCYVLYYRLAPGPRFWDGLIPLAADALVAAAFLGTMTLS